MKLIKNKKGQLGNVSGRAMGIAGAILGIFLVFVLAGALIPTAITEGDTLNTSLTTAGAPGWSGAVREETT